MKAASILLIVFLLLFTTCQKEKLPKPTREGKNTFGCKINGKNWVPHGGGGFSGIEPVAGGYQAKYIFNTTDYNVFIYAYNGKTGVELYIRNVQKPGIYPLNFNTLDYYNTHNPQNYGYYDSDKDIFITTSKYTGKVNITRADTINKIISGTFEFTAVNKNTGQTVKITDGRFDVATHP